MSSRKATGQEGLLMWLQAHTHGYSGVNVVDFTYSWENGLAFCALVHAFHPEKIPFSELKAENKEQNLKLAFDTAAVLGIPALMEPEDMLLDCGPDRFSVVTYLSQFFHKFKDYHKKAIADTVDKDEEVRKRREMLDKALARPERKCSKCGGSMSQGTIVEALGKNFHTTCFVCTSCSKPFANNKFMNVDGNPYCATCGRKAFSTNKSAPPPPAADSNPPCGKCGELCGGDTIDAMGQSWHPKCFVCCTCSKSFPNGKFLNVDNKPYCEQCGRKAFISTRLKPAAPPEPKPAAAGFQSPSSMSKSKSMFITSSGNAVGGGGVFGAREAPKLGSNSATNTVSSRLSMFQPKEDNPDIVAARTRTPSSAPAVAPFAVQENTASRGSPVPSPVQTIPSVQPPPSSVPSRLSPVPSPSVSSPSGVDKSETAEDRRAKRAAEEAKKKKEAEEREAKRKEIEELERVKKEEQRKQREEEKKRKKIEEEEKKRKEAEEKEAKKKEEEELKKKKSEEKRKQMEDIKKKKEEEDAKKKKELDEEEAKKKEEKLLRAEQAKKKREEMKKLVEDEEARKQEAKELERKKLRFEIGGTTNLVIEPKPATSSTPPATSSTPPATSTPSSTFTFAVPSSAPPATSSTPPATSSPRTTSGSTATSSASPASIVLSPVTVELRLSNQRASKEISSGNVTCPAADVMCPWSGTEGGLLTHTPSCHYIALKPVLSTLIKQNQEIMGIVKDLQQQVASLKR